MAQQANGHTVADIYKGVINDVINQVREAFLDENVDVDVLSQLKKEWEEKVNSSGCVDLDSRNHAHLVPPPTSRPMHPGMARGPVTVNRQPNQQVIPGQIQVQHHGVHMDGQVRQQMQMQYGQQQPGMPQIQPGQMGVPFPTGGSVRMVPSMQPTGQPFMLQNQGMMFIQNANGQHIPVTMGPNGMIQQRPQGQSGVHHQQLHQLDGNGDFDFEETIDVAKDLPTSSKRLGSMSQTSKPKKPSKKEAEHVMMGLLKVLQLDGGGGGMSDSSSEEEEEENDPLRRMANRIGGDGQIEDGDTIAEEDPLNSGDDQSDDEDLETLFDAENVIMCQFEKIHRARSKWKFQLKDGIMHIDNKDYCFQKCSGEAEW